MQLVARINDSGHPLYIQAKQTTTSGFASNVAFDPLMIVICFKCFFGYFANRKESWCVDLGSIDPFTLIPFINFLA